MLAGDAGSAVAEVSDTSSTTIAADHQSAELHLVIVDAAVADAAPLLKAIPKNAEVLLLDSQHNGVEQISQYLTGRENLQSIHILSHGSDGAIQLGNTVLDAEKLEQSSADISKWSRSLSSSADILIYGCDVAATEKGQAFIRNFASTTGADVAASSDRTGKVDSELSDWELEFQFGDVQDQQLLTAAALQQYQGSLPLTIYAAGSTGDELMELEINGEIVDTWFVQGTNAEEGQFYPYTVNLDGLSIDDVKINFVNDLYDPANSIDRNLRIDRVVVDGVEYQAEDPSVFAEGVYVEGLGIQSGNLQTEYLNSNGFMRFSSSVGSGNGSLLEVSLSGSTGTENAEISVNGQVIEEIFNVSQKNQIYSFQSSQAITADQVQIAFTNDVFESGFDRNLNVDFIRVDGETFQTEDLSTFSTGTWLAEDGVQSGYRQSETLHSNGYFQYLTDENGGGDAGSFLLVTNGIDVNEGSSSVTLQIDRVGGSEGAASLDYLTADETALAGQDYQAAAGSLFFADGETSKSVTINLFDDNDNEGTETFSFRLTNPNNAGLLAPRTSNIRIIDNDSTLPVFDSFVDDGQITLNGDAVISGGNLQLTAAQQQERGSAYFNTAVPISSDTSFQATFTASFTGGQGSSGGEGLAFVIQNSPSGVFAQNAVGQGNYAGALNYHRVRESVAVELDTFKNSYEALSDKITITAGAYLTEPIANIESPFNLKDGTSYNVWVDYNGQSDVLAVYVSPNSEKPEFAVLKATVDLASYVGDQAFVGFAASTGTNFNNTLIEKWAFTLDTPVEDPPTFPTGTATEIDLITGLDQPTKFTWGDNGRNLYVAEKSGVLKVSRDGNDVQTVLDISSQVNDYQDRGLIGMELHPDFESNGYIYLFYTVDPPEIYDNIGNAFAGPDGKGNRAGKLVRVTADASTGFTSIIDGSEFTLLGSESTWENFNAFTDSTLDFNEPQAGRNPDGTYINDFINSDSRSHTVGSLAFAPDGSLYASIGDGASFNQTDNRAYRVQDLDSLSGKVLRIDPITGQGLSDNPFYNGNPNDNRSKVYQLGLRNPWRLSVDEVTGQLFIGETGLTSFEEINSAGPGANFGWPAYEGSQSGNKPTPSYANLPRSQAFYQSGGATAPLISLAHGSGRNVIVAGDVTYDLVYGPQYDGDLFYNDFGRGIVRHAEIDPDGNLVGTKVFATDAQWIVDIQQGPDDFLYYANLVDGTIGRWELV